jgi:hypothetical protein
MLKFEAPTPFTAAREAGKAFVMSFVGALILGAASVALIACIFSIFGFAGFIVTQTDKPPGSCSGEGVCAALASRGVYPPNTEYTAMYSSYVVPGDDGIRLVSKDTSGYSQTAGQYNGGGVGNRVFAGLREYCGQPVRDISAWTVVASAARGVAADVEFNMMVDVDGSGTWSSGDCIVMLDASSNPDFALPVDGTPTVLEWGPSQTIWRSIGAGCALPSSAGTTYAALTGMTGYATTARVFCGVQPDSGYPAATPMAGMQWIQGGTATTGFLESRLHSFFIQT